MTDLMARTTTVGDCHVWQGAKTAKGYGSVRHAGKTCLAHRVSYELFVGPIPDGLVIDHLCRVRACINPAHLEPVTNRVNILRGESLSAQYARATHCIHGHEFTPANTILKRSGKRQCRACKYEAERAKRARRI